MLSVRRRQEDGGGLALGGGGGGGMDHDDDAELEEGEACGDDTAFVDPDVALSYIDEKLQDVLGHFQKDFEGGMSAENLGSKFGGYGSFLPTYQRSPLLPPTRSPPKAANLSSRSPYHQSTEAVTQNSTAVAVPSVSQNNGSVAPFSGDSIKKERCESTTAKRSTSTHDPSYGSSKSSDQNRFKVRIKVGSDNVLARNNAAIYSGLGLDISSPSSVEDSPDGYRGLSPEFDNVQLESPRTILQIMTCFSVPGGFLLSPLQGSILQLTKKVPSSKKWETGVDIENAQEASEGHVVKKMKPDGKKKKAIEMKRLNNTSDGSAVMKKEIDMETLAGQKIVSEALNIPLLSSSRGMETKGESQFEEETAGKPLEGNKDSRLKEWAINSNSKTIEAETVKAETTKCLESGGFGSSEMECSAVKREPKPMTEKTASTLEETNTTNDTDFLLDRKHERRVKPESKSNGAGVNFEDNTVIDERAPAVCRSMEKVPSKETSLYDTHAKNNSKSEAKRVHREQKKNTPTSSDFLDVDNGVRSSAAVKERKNDSLSKSSHSGKKPKAKSLRDVRDSLPDGSYGCKEQDIVVNGGGLGELQPKEKSMSKRDFDMPGASKREISSSARHDRHTASEEPKMHVPPASVSTANAAPALQVPVVIEEHWVQCDICQKWRLLPYETDTTTLPKEWKCSMQLWLLPGMNRCDVGEDETTNALNALYVIPAPANGIPPVGHRHVASSGLTTASTFSVNGPAEQSRKRKSVAGDRSSVIEGCHPTQASAYTVSNQHAPTRIKSTADSNPYPTERNSVSKSVDPFTEKKKSKSKSRGSYSDGGDLVERHKKHSKGKSKREMDHGEYKASKKIKKEDRHRSSRDQNAKCDLASGDITDEAKALLLKATTLNSLGEKGDVSSLKQKNAPRYDRLEMSKRDKDDGVVLSEDRNKEIFHTSDAQRSDFSSKKRIVKEWEESQHNSIAHVSNGTTVNHSSAAKETYKDQNLKETKSNLKKSEELYSTTDSRSLKGQILSYNEGHANNELVEDSTDFAGKRGPSELLVKRSSEQALDLSGPASSDMAHIQTTAVTSSSSKASDSQKKKQNSHVAKTSPIQSVSSSPVRNSNIDKLLHNRILEKDGPMNANSSTMLNSVKYLNSEAGIVDNVRQVKKFKDSLLASEPVLHGSLQGSSDKDDDLVQLTRGHAPERISLKKGLDDDPHHASGRKDSTVNGSSASRGYNHLHSGDKNSLRTDSSLVQPRAAILDAKGDTIVNANKKSAASIQDRNGTTHCPPDGNFQPELPSGKDKSYPKSNKQDAEKPKAPMAPSPLKETHSTPVKSNASKLTPQSRRCNDENGGQHGVSKQSTSNPADTSSPARKDGNSTAYALKEARDLKHKANRLKKEGKDLESTRLYFEAALKFLHVASLLEPPSIDGGKQGDAAQSMYSDTAKLCNFVAHEYERCKKMAAAALAYKCVEVAYLKAAYYKYPIASKDRQVLQAVVQTTPGESPSSSASDIDNLNNNGLSKKPPSNKDANSPQVAGNHMLLAVRNQPHLTRLLAYTNDVNCAFEATRKSQTAIASAAGNHEKGVDGVSSVRTVLDFNFRSVNDLLRLVRLSMESISC